MSNPEVSTAPNMTWITIRALAISVVITMVITALFALTNGSGGRAYTDPAVAHAQLHAPRLELIAAAPLAIRLHLATVLAALVLATVQILGPKGRRLHRVLGWTLAVLLVTTAIFSLFIRNPGGGLFNPFQLFSAWTLVAIPLSVLAARAHKVRRHAAMMMGLYVGGLLLAGALTFLPGRLMWRVFFG